MAANQEDSSLAHKPVGFRGTISPSNGAEVPRRLRELGFVPGTEVSVLRRGPLGDPLELELRGYRICLRRADLTEVRVDPVSEPDS